jgi:hypothetical protein
MSPMLPTSWWPTKIKIVLCFSAYRLYGLNGQELSSGPLTSGMQSIAAPTSAGLYFIEAHGPQGSVRQKVIIVH